MLVFKQGSPEAQLLDLFQLAERIGIAQQFNAGPGAADLDEATQIAREALAARVRAVSAEVAKAPAAPTAPEFAPVDPSTLKVGDEVWIRAYVDALDLNDRDNPVETDQGSWPTPRSIYRRSA